MILVDKSSILNLDGELKAFGCVVPNAQYSMVLSAKFFSYLPQSNLNFISGNFLQDLYAEELFSGGQNSTTSGGVLKGTFKDVEFSIIQRKIGLFFAHMPDELISVNYAPNSPEHLRIVSEFWSFVGKYIALPPSRSLEYYPAEKSYLNTSSGWSCSAVFLEEARTKGLFIYLDGSPD